MLSPSASNIRDVFTLPSPFDGPPKTGVNNTTPTRPKHTLTRSISDISPPMQRHHHPHLHRHHGHKDRELTPLDTRSAVVTPAGSRRPSLSDDRDGGSKASARLPGVPREADRRLVSAEELSKEREKGVMRVMELKKGLVEMNDMSIGTTRRLDNTYYSILEKLSSLQNTISSLKELAIMSRALKDEFEGESKSIVQELEEQLDGFEDFGEQQAKIEGLEKRIMKGRERVSKLGERVKVVSSKIDVWEAREGQWQTQMRRRMRILWVVTAFVGMLVLGLMMYQYTPVKDHGLGVLKGLNLSNVSMELPELPDATELLINETLHIKMKASDAMEALRKPPENRDDDPVLRAFDEL